MWIPVDCRTATQRPRLKEEHRRVLDLRVFRTKFAQLGISAPFETELALSYRPPIWPDLDSYKQEELSVEQGVFVN